MSTQNPPRLGPAWRNKTGFQPPPTVNDRPSSSSSERKEEDPERFSSRSTLFNRSSSHGQGRSLADLAASVPRRNTVVASSTHGGEGSGGEKVIRYTREKLLSLRPRPGEELPECLRGMEGSVVISSVAQDPGEFSILWTCLIWTS